MLSTNFMHSADPRRRVQFTFRLRTGEIIVSAMTPPIRITDDHKTDVTKPKVPSVSAGTRPRKSQGRASVASSRPHSPTLSEAESIQSVSEAGAVKQKQTPQVRTKPYERPANPAPHANTDFHRSKSLNIDSIYPLCDHATTPHIVISNLWTIPPG